MRNMATASRDRVLWFWRIFWFVVLVGGTAAMFPLSRHFSEKLRVEQARDELAQMQKMLGAYRERTKGWPLAFGNQQLVQAFLGKLEPLPKSGKPQWYLAGTRLYFRPIDPEVRGAEVVDPWGRPYAYHYHAVSADGTPSYVLFSGGPDGKYSPPRTWKVGSNGLAPEDLDNLCVFPPPPAGAP